MFKSIPLQYGNTVENQGYTQCLTQDGSTRENSDGNTKQHQDKHGGDAVIAKIMCLEGALLLRSS